MTTADRIISMLGSVETDDMPMLLQAILNVAKESDVIEALRTTHPDLVDAGE